MNENLSKIVKVMKKTYGRDISIYENSFLIKSLERRRLMMGVSNEAEYFRWIESNSAEADAFYHSLHITYSQFFRDPFTFASLEQNIVPEIMANAPEGSEIRIWSAGCANGQEAYSVAMLLADSVQDSGKEFRFRIFATDIDDEALAVGRAGVYDEKAIQNVKMKHLKKYFTKQDKTYTIIPELRQYVNFSSYDLLDLSTANPPESIYGDFDVVMCCNLLFYYTADLQQIMIKKLQQAISTTGYLVTGEAEKSQVEKASKLQTIMIPTAVVFQND
ncbi:MAG: CheR family methyltransferase [Mobilitalea sp.]